LASPTPKAQDAAQILAASHDWVPLDEADAVVVLGGDGFMLQVLHQMLDLDRVVPAYGLNLGTVGFLMNKQKSSRSLEERLSRARPVAISPLRMDAVTNAVKRKAIMPSTKSRCCARRARPPSSK
jgi:NAD+ kinase